MPCRAAELFCDLRICSFAEKYLQEASSPEIESVEEAVPKNKHEESDDEKSKGPQGSEPASPVKKKPLDTCE